MPYTATPSQSRRINARANYHVAIPTDLGYIDQLLQAMSGQQREGSTFVCGSAEGQYRHTGHQESPQARRTPLTVQEIQDLNTAMTQLFQRAPRHHAITRAYYRLGHTKPYPSTLRHYSLSPEHAARHLLDALRMLRNLYTPSKGGQPKPQLRMRVAVTVDDGVD